MKALNIHLWLKENCQELSSIIQSTENGCHFLSISVHMYTSVGSNPFLIKTWTYIFSDSDWVQPKSNFEPFRILLPKGLMS